jgi:hypothetical protein
MKHLARYLTTALSAVALTMALPASNAMAGGRGGYGGGHHGGGGYYGHGGGGHHGSHWGGLGWGLGIGLGLGYLGAREVYSNRGYYNYGPDYVVVEPQVVYREVPRTVYREVPAPVYTPPARPDPIIYPRSGQTPAQTEADRQACNRWATTQQNAMSDSSVFNRATEACMDGRGYTMR